MSPKKRKNFTIEAKAHIIWRLENGERNHDLAKELGVSHSTISTIWNKREKVLEFFEKNKWQNKRERSCENPDVDKALLAWFTTQRAKNVPLNGPILQEKANELGKKLGKTDFNCSTAWIQRFRARHNIVFGKISGESAAVAPGVVEDWLKNTWPSVSKGYSPDDIFNADEAGLFFKLLPNQTLRFKGEKCSGGKLAKDRLTVMVAANMTGTCKKKTVCYWKSKATTLF